VKPSGPAAVAYWGAQAGVPAHDAERALHVGTGWTNRTYAAQHRGNRGNVIKSIWTSRRNWWPCREGTATTRAC
jgi:hypothetical protein